MDIKKELQKLWDGAKGDYEKLSMVEFNDIGMRGVKNVSLEFRYPITAIAGVNGIGKTTILQVLACLFHNTDNGFIPYRFSNAKTQHSNYRFTDFFVTSRGENNGLGAAIKYKFEKRGQPRNTFAVKKISRWTNYERRPNRYVDFLGISRVLPAYEFAAFRKTFSGNYTITNSSSLNEEDRQAISAITGKNLSDISEESSANMQNFKLSRIQTRTDNIEYSSFNMGAGEEVAITLISRVSSLPQGSLILIEEIELGLHPRAQKELIEVLMKIVLANRLQLVFTTHSPYIFDILPPNAKILLRKLSGSIDVLYAPSNSMAFIELTGSDHKDLTIYVEDEIAKQLIENLFNASISKRIQIIDVGSNDNVVRLTAAHYINPELGKAIGIPDGDIAERIIRKGCSNYMLKNGENCSDEAFQHRKSNYFPTLPSDQVPEKYILEKMRENIDFIQDIDDSDEFNQFIQNQLDISEDHHALFFKISQFLSKDEEGIKRDILRFVAKNYKDEFQEIIELVNNKLEV